jgi:CRISPR system Cascade subunit CasD
MPQFILFTLWAPLAAMGEVAVGERRGGFDRPARSAVLGLVAAALGIDRHHENGHAGLESGYALALRVLSPGTLIQDYHTVQAPPARRGRQWPTRAAALEEPDLETLLSRREYRADPVVTIALAARPGADPDPDRIASALRRPVFALYFGRKSCPLGLPMAPLVTESTTLSDALRVHDERLEPSLRDLLSPLRFTPSRSRLYCDRDFLDEHAQLPGFEIRSVVRRRDRIASRRRWQFAVRDEVVAMPAGSNQFEPGGVQ